LKKIHRGYLVLNADDDIFRMGKIDVELHQLENIVQ